MNRGLLRAFLYLSIQVYQLVVAPQQTRATRDAGVMQARWTPAEDAGSLRFSQRYRDQEGEDYGAWAVTDRELNMSKLARHTCGCLVIAVLGVAVRWLYRRLRVHLSDRTAAQLVADDAKGAQEASRQKAAAAVAAAAASASVPTGPLDRFCRFCDMAIDEEFVQSHLQGKRHQKLRAAAGSLASDDVWVWRPAREKVVSAAPAAPEPEVMVPRADLLPALGKTGKVKGQTGKWAKVEKKTK